METSVLNLAHEKQRRAEALLREGKFEEAAKCHETVADLLAEAYAQIEAGITNAYTPILPSRETSKFLSIQSFVTLESLSLQRDYHKRQAAVVRMKQLQFEEYKATLENQQKDLLSKQIPKHEKDNCMESRNDKLDGSLRQTIYKTMDDQDNLLNLISLSNTDDKALKHSKDSGTIMEDLKTVNCQLRCLVGSLFSQLEIKEEEIQQLRKRLYAIAMNSNDDMRSEEPHPLHLAPLPPLTPLEMPLFDFTSS